MITESELELLKELRREVSQGLLTSHQHSGKCNAVKALENVMKIIEREGCRYARQVMDSLEKDGVLNP